MGVEEMQLTAVCDSLRDEDLLPDGTAIRLLNIMSDDIAFVEGHLVPLLQLADAEKIVILLQGMRAEQFVKFLRTVSPQKILRLLDHTNADLVVCLCNGPLEELIPALADKAGSAMKSSTVALVSEHVGNKLAAGLAVIDRGKAQRGVASADAYQFGDFSRGIAEKLKEMRCRSHSRSPPETDEPFPYEAGDKVQVWCRGRSVWLDGTVQEVIRASCFSASVRVQTVKAGVKHIRPEDVEKQLRRDAHGMPTFKVGHAVRIWCRSERKWRGGVVSEVCETTRIHEGINIEEGCVWAHLATRTELIRRQAKLIRPSELGRLLRHAPWPAPAVLAIA